MVSDPVLVGVAYGVNFLFSFGVAFGIAKWAVSGNLSMQRAIGSFALAFVAGGLVGVAASALLYSVVGPLMQYESSRTSLLIPLMGKCLALSALGAWDSLRRERGKLKKLTNQQNSDGAKLNISCLPNDPYAEALAEIEEQRMHKGTWAQCFAEADGDESRAKASYIKKRVTTVASATEFGDTRPLDVVTKKPVQVSSKSKLSTSSAVRASSSGPGLRVVGFSVLAVILMVVVVAVGNFLALRSGSGAAQKTAVAAPVRAPANRSQIDEFLDEPPKTTQTAAPELKPFSSTLDDERKIDFSFTPEEDKRVLEDREIMKQQGIGGSQSLADVVAWGDAQLSARLINDESGRRKAHDFALMWQTQIASKLQDSPEHSLFMGFRLVMNFYDEKRGICRPDMSMHGGIENLPGKFAKFYPECFTHR